LSAAVGVEVGVGLGVEVGVGVGVEVEVEVGVGVGVGVEVGIGVGVGVEVEVSVSDLTLTSILHPSRPPKTSQPRRTGVSAHTRLYCPEYRSRNSVWRLVIGTSRPEMNTRFTSDFTSSGSPSATTIFAVLPTSSDPN
jgi:hypothetical protein